jgi:hypothetical protein
MACEVHESRPMSTTPLKIRVIAIPAAILVWGTSLAARQADASRAAATRAAEQNGFDVSRLVTTPQAAQE